jgi:hypothetical protein
MDRFESDSISDFRVLRTLGSNRKAHVSWLKIFVSLDMQWAKKAMNKCRNNGAQLQAA